MTDEEYVRERWKFVVSRKRDDMDAWELNLGGPWFDNTFENQEKAIAAARTFTEAREEAIRLVEEEITAIEFFLAEDCSPEEEATIYKRILARELAALAELKRGMTT